MKLTIFSRLVIGYLVLFVLAMTVSIYAISQLRLLESVTRSILFVDSRQIELKKKLSDILLSMMRYEKKFIIIKDEGLLNQFLLVRTDFDRQLKELLSRAETDTARNIINRVELQNRRYQELFGDEVTYLKAGREYKQDYYRKEKESAVNEIMKSLQELEAYSQSNTYSKVKRLNAADVNASRVAILIGIVSLIFGIIISIIITINITRPLSVIKRKTGDIARGEFGDDLKITSPPEIMLLTESFNMMCNKLKEVDKMKSDFFSLMSHELRTPLTTIKEGTNLFIESLDEVRATEKQKRLMTIINEECNRLIMLVNSLLDLSKMEAGMMECNFHNTELAPLITKISEEMEPLAETKNIKLEADVNKALPHIKVDVERILQVLRNLVGNAVKFTPNNGHVRIFAGPDDQGVKVSVSDTGAGISKEKVDMIFDKYHQAALSGSNKMKGTGLGLSIVRQIINAHGGRVWVESTSSQGSTFSFLLPV